MGKYYLSEQTKNLIQKYCDSLEKSAFEYDSKLSNEEKCKKIDGQIEQLDYFIEKVRKSSINSSNKCDKLRFLQGSSALLIILFGLISMQAATTLFLSLSAVSLATTIFAAIKVFVASKKFGADLEFLRELFHTRTNCLKFKKEFEPENVEEQNIDNSNTPTKKKSIRKVYDKDDNEDYHY